MTWSWDEYPVSLEKLDDHLKALLRLKIREFVHFSPCFRDVPSVDPMLLGDVLKADSPTMMMRHRIDSQCPNRKFEGVVGRRHVRTTLKVSSL
jgi:hypothetical protein